MPRKKKAKVGRPNLPKDKVRGHVTPIRLQDDERAMFQQAAQDAGLSFSEWVRQALKTAANGTEITTAQNKRVRT